MKSLKLYYILDEYIDYLRTFDSKVFYNKKQTRPYVGVVLEYNNFYYFAPLASPKPKHREMNSHAADVFKLDDGNLGIININNMIPTPLFCLREVLPLVNDLTYKLLLKKQIKFINSNKKELYSKINKFYRQFKKGHLNNKLLSRCCNFTLLEDKCLVYQEKEYINL